MESMIAMAMLILELKKFHRVTGGGYSTEIRRVYRLVNDWGADASMELHFNAASQEGVFFHLIGALSGFGKLGVVCVSRTPAAATRLYERTVSVLDEAAAEE